MKKSLINEVVSQAIKKQQLIKQPVLVAVSTGVDSMSLLFALQNLPKAWCLEIHVAYLDHCFRAQSKVETAFIKQYCKEHDLPLHFHIWPAQDHPQTGFEAAARDQRYQFFLKVMQEQGISTLLTAHHADDQIETFLMKFIRGGELEQLQGIAPVRAFGENFKIVRPLLTVAKTDIYHYAHQHNLTYFEDETNQTDDYLRNRMRHQIVPQLKAENQQVLKQTAYYQQQLSDLLEVANEAITALMPEMTLNDGSYLLAYFQKLNPSWQRLLLKKLAQQHDCQLSQNKLAQMQKLLLNSDKPQGQINLTSELVLLKSYTTFKFSKVLSEQLFAPQKLPLNQWVNLPNNEQIGLFTLESAMKQSCKSADYLELAELPDCDLYVRKRQPGDRLITKAGLQKVKKILIDKKVPKSQRANQLIVGTLDSKVYWLLGIKKSDLSRGVLHVKIQYMILHRNQEF